jgi:hypothetical protein
VTIVWLVSDLLTVLAKDSLALEEKVPVAATTIARFFLRLLFSFGLSIERTTWHVRGRTLTRVRLFVG